jgi:dienelactone hydrolase
MRKTHCLVLFVGLLLVFAAQAAAQSFTVEQIIKSPFPSEMTAAPRGNVVAWVFNAEGRRNVAAGRYLQGRPDVDPARIGLWGGSYGGYLTAMGLARNSDIFAAGVDLHGVHNRTTGRAAAAGNPEARRLAWQSSPVADVDKWRSPVLLIHADDDRNVDFAQTVELAARLRQRGVTFEQIIYPDDVHDFLLHRRWLEVYQATAAFFDKHLKNAGASRADGGGR